MKMNFKNVCAIFRREFLGFFRTPVAYVFLVVFIIASFGLTWFIGQQFESNEASMERFFQFLPWIFLFLVPAAGMRLWAEEQRSGTSELLFTLPIDISEAVIGKFLAAWAFLGLGLLGTVTLPITLSYLGNPDWAVIFTGYFGALLMAGAYLGICSLASAFSRSQVISFVISVVVCLVLVLLGWSVFNAFLINLHLPVAWVDAIANISFIPHFNPMTMGLVRLQDVGYFLTMIVVALSLNTLVLKR